MVTVIALEVKTIGSPKTVLKRYRVNSEDHFPSNRKTHPSKEPEDPLPRNRNLFPGTGRPSSQEPEDPLQVKIVKKNVIITRGHRFKPDDLSLDTKME